MKKRYLGADRLEVSAMGLGCWGMSGAYGEGDQETSMATIQQAFDAGVTFIDTADIYGHGHNESLVAEAIAGFRQSVVLASKFGFRMSDNGKLEVCGRPEYVHAACDASLKRLKTDHIDLYYLHRLDKDVPIEETVGAMGQLVEAGKIRYLGLSEVSAQTLQRAHTEYPITALQSEYSLTTRDVEGEILPFCKEEQIGLVPFCPLGRGLLTGALQHITAFPAGDYRADLPRFQGENLKLNQQFAAAIIEIANQKGIKPAQLALSWLLHQSDGIVPIPGMKTTRYMDQNLASVAIDLSANELNQLNEVKLEIKGQRYSEGNMSFLDI